ncbi:MAG TPA: CBS domain-containing protein [Sedimentisphaerales bacterium]|nr:CBS domain-containing protein [Sedimentisphaerales bacterium]
MISLDKIMTRDVVVIEPTADIYDAIRMMSDGNITGLPVVDEDGKLVGVVTERDVMKRLLTTQSTEGQVQDCMTTDVVSFDVNDGFLDVISTLVEKRFRRVPIESEGRLAGIVSRSDIISYLFSCELKDRGVVAAAVRGKVVA